MTKEVILVLHSASLMQLWNLLMLLSMILKIYPRKRYTPRVTISKSLEALWGIDLLQDTSQVQLLSQLQLHRSQRYVILQCSDGMDVTCSFSWLRRTICTNGPIWGWNVQRYSHVVPSREHCDCWMAPTTIEKLWVSSWPPSESRCRLHNQQQRKRNPSFLSSCFCQVLFCLERAESKSERFLAHNAVEAISLSVTQFRNKRLSE